MKLSSTLHGKVSAKCQCFNALLCKAEIGDSANSTKHWRTLGLLPADSNSSEDVDLRQLMEAVPGINDCVSDVIRFLTEGPTPEHDRLYRVAEKNGELRTKPYSFEALMDYKRVTLGADEVAELQSSYDALLDETALKRAVFAVYSMRYPDFDIK